MNLPDMIAGTPEVLVTNVGGKVMADSLGVAEKFGKAHKTVIRSVEELTNNLAAQNCATKNYFVESDYENRGRKYKKYLLTRDGFSLLVMGFTGPSAIHWKVRYIEAFNKMEEQLRKQPEDMEAVIAGVTAKVASQVIPEVMKQLLPYVQEAKAAQAAQAAQAEPTAMEDGRKHNSRRIQYLLGNKEALPNFLTVYDMRDYLGIGQKLAYQYIHEKGFPKIATGNRYLIPKEEFLEWVEQKKK